MQDRGTRVSCGSIGCLPHCSQIGLRITERSSPVAGLIRDPNRHRGWRCQGRFALGESDARPITPQINFVLKRFEELAERVPVP